MNPGCSIIVVNKDDRGIAETLAELVSLPAVVQGEAEIIVVDASAGRLGDLARDFSTVRWLDFVPDKRRATIPHQRNVGVRASLGGVVVFIDASCVPADGWLSRLCDPLRDDGETIVAGSHRSTSGRGLRDQATHRLVDKRYLGEAPTINVAIRRTLFDQVGYFDEQFGYGSDVDFFWRAVDAGHRIRYIPEAAVNHNWGGPRTEARRSYVYGRARARLYLKHPQRWRNLFGRDAPVLVYPAYLLLLPVMMRRPYLHLALAVPLWRNRSRRPVITVVDHFLYGAGVLRELASRLGGERPPSPAVRPLAARRSSSSVVSR